MTTKTLAARAKDAGIKTAKQDDFVVATGPTVSLAVQITEERTSKDAIREATELALMAAAALTNFKGMTISQEPEEDADFVASKDGEELARDPDLDDLIQTLAEMAESGEVDEDDGEGKGSVVPAKYKTIYAERNNGDATHCGDWLANTLNSLCHVPVADGRKKMRTDLDRFETICVANGVDQTKLTPLRTGTNGWQGRFRMTARNLLTPLVAVKGDLFVPEGCGVDADQHLPAPKAWCQQHAPKATAKTKAAVEASTAKQVEQTKTGRTKAAAPAKTNAPRKRAAKKVAA